MKLYTEVSCKNISVRFSPGERTCLLGSCFADTMAVRLSQAGFPLLANPFGTLYNPASIAAAVRRLDGAEPFTPLECVEMGAGAGLVCSYSHHTSFARPTREAFLEEANRRLAADAESWKACSRVIVTLGTARVWRAKELPGQPVVANCLKRPAREFTHELLSVESCTQLLASLVESHPEKQFLFTVSPIRHLGEGARENSVSKATLHLALQPLLERFAPRVDYFPAYEILLDELRDYRFFAEDLVHPAPAAIQVIWERFLDACTDPADRPRILEAEKAARAARHREILRGK
ncbi:MAG: GSCFA domain-containing protein [Bacteroidales bacterium]|nr:GSCFA domain-containing protein [Bacteroidales bacterium]